MVIHISLTFIHRFEKILDYLISDFLNYILFLLFSLMFSSKLVILFNDEFIWFSNNNELFLIILIFSLIIIFFSMFYYFYDMMKYSKIYIKNVAINLLIIFCFIVILGKIKYLFLNTYSILLLINIFHYMLIVIFFISFITSFIIITSRRIQGDPINNCFKSIQYYLDKLLKEYHENSDCESQESLAYKNLIDISNIAHHYTDGIEEIKKSFGKEMHFDKVTNSNTKQNLNEMLNQLTFSIPYYIFYGGKEQIKVMDMHLKNINNSLGDVYSIEGSTFIAEILEMNNKINNYFIENSFEFSSTENANIDKYGYYKKQIFLFVLALMSSIIISRLV